MRSSQREMLGVEQLRNHVDACLPRNMDVLVLEGPHNKYFTRVMKSRRCWGLL